MRILEIPLDSILELITVAEDYGFNKSILISEFADMMHNTLTEEEIELYAQSVEATEGYGVEDYESAKERLTEFKQRYCNEATISS